MICIWGCCVVNALGAVVCLSHENTAPCLFLQDILFDPAARWLAVSLERAGVERFFVLCDECDRPAAEDCFPAGTLFSRDRADLLAFLGEVSRVLVIARPLFLTSTALLSTDAPALAQALADASDPAACLSQHQTPTPGALSLTDSDAVQAAARRASVARLQAGGVRFVDRDQAYIGPDVTVGEGTRILPGVILKGKTVIGPDCVIGPNTMIDSCVIGARVTVNASQLNESTVDDDTAVGPFAYVRPNCHVGKKVKVGDFVELKNSTVGDGTKISHLTYVGDTDAGSRINFGCGTVTVNYDGKKKFRTTIGDGAFIGCNTNLVAPVTVGEGAYTAAGSTITQDVPADALAIARERQTVKEDWAARRRES